MSSESITLFLDFDGVLHADACRPELYFNKLPLLASWLADNPSVSIVVSSTWRTRSNLTAVMAGFPLIVQERFAGCTAQFKDLDQVPSHMAPYPRQVECERWMRTHRAPYDTWFALDDRNYLFRPFCEHLILVDRTVGLTPDDLARLSMRMRMRGVA